LENRHSRLSNHRQNNNFKVFGHLNSSSKLTYKIENSGQLLLKVLSDIIDNQPLKSKL